MVGPQRKRGAHLALVARSVVDARRAARVAGLMAKDLLEDVRLLADVCQIGGAGAAEIVQRPRLHRLAEPSVEIALGTPLREAEIGALPRRVDRGPPCAGPAR